MGYDRFLYLTPVAQSHQSRSLLETFPNNPQVSQLKSCLQKSIRRRAPLPAIRVAMELVDRSWCDLIRRLVVRAISLLPIEDTRNSAHAQNGLTMHSDIRLPIIVLEDSTLHPDFGLLVWLMVAESKVSCLLDFFLFQPELLVKPNVWIRSNPPGVRSLHGFTEKGAPGSIRDGIMFTARCSI
jgi:hypothetical protein